jgi:hypothetical protein
MVVTFLSLDFYEVNSKIVCMTSDNAANEKKAIRDMGMFVTFIHPVHISDLI